MMQNMRLLHQSYTGCTFRLGLSVVAAEAAIKIISSFNTRGHGPPARGIHTLTRPQSTEARAHGAAAVKHGPAPSGHDSTAAVMTLAVAVRGGRGRRLRRIHVETAESAKAMH